MDRFSPEASLYLENYVYCLIDPESKKPFYLGKGSEDRVFSHAKGNPKDPADSDKLEVIKKIIDKKQKVGHVIIRHGMDAKTALAVEASLIDFANRFTSGVTNLVRGHHSETFGLMSANEINRRYSAEQLTKL